jgi:hypothetical protein
MRAIRIFRYLPDLDAFDVTPEYARVAGLLGLAEWNAVNWIGRLFSMDNDFGEHWFDNWDARDRIRERAAQAGLNADTLLVLEPGRFSDGRDGPCHSPEIRARFWRDVLRSLELSADLLFDQARAVDRELRALVDAGDVELAAELIPDLESRIAALIEEGSAR